MRKTKESVISQRTILVLTLLIFDALAVFCASITAYYLRNKGIFRLFLDSVQPIGMYLQAIPVAVFLLLTLFAFSGLYEPKKRITAFSEMYSSFEVTTLWILLIMGGSYLSKFDYSRIIVILFYFFTSLFVMAGRVFIRQLQIRFAKNGFGRVNILIVGTGNQAKEIARRLEKYSSVGFNVVMLLEIKKLASLNSLIKRFQVQQVYIVDKRLSYRNILNIIAKVKNKNVMFKITSNIFDLVARNIDISNLESIPSLDVGKVYFPLWKKLYRRVFDICFASFFLIITFPLWVFIAAIIKLDSKGKVIIIQKRIGFEGKLFYMYKFRTMHQKSSLYESAPRNKNDNRVTKVGKILRKTSLDELPQLINILKGDMSIVGPRPEMPFIVRKYSLWEKRRLAVKPGLTGLWQILGRKELPLSQNLEYDFYYINNQSFVLDLVIILKTIPLVVLGKGAY